MMEEPPVSDNREKTLWVCLQVQDMELPIGTSFRDLKGVHRSKDQEANSSSLVTYLTEVLLTSKEILASDRLSTIANSDAYPLVKVDIRNISNLL